MNNVKRLTAALLALVMALSLGACGSSSSNGGTGTSKADEETPAYVYNAEFNEILSDSESYMNPRLFTDNGFYATAYVKVGEREHPEDEPASYEGEYDIYENRLYFVDFSGTVSELVNYKPVGDTVGTVPDGDTAEAVPAGAVEMTDSAAAAAAQAEAADTAAVDTSNLKDYYSGSDLAGIGAGSEGKLIVMESTYASWYDGPDDLTEADDEYYNYRQYESAYYIRSLDKDGNVLSSAKVETVGDDDYGNSIYAYNFLVDDNDNVIAPGDAGIYVIALDGSITANIPNDDGGFVDSLVRLGDGSVAATMWGENGMELRRIDVENKTLGDALPLPNGAYNLVSGGGDYDVYYTNGVYFYGYKFDTEENVKLFNWINCDINGDNASSVQVRDDGSIITVINDYSSTDESYTITLATVSLVPYDSVPHKEELTLATQYLNWDVRDKIVAFNRKNDNYRIVVNDYSEFNTEDDYSAGQTKLTTELLAGNVPDIIDLTGVPYTQLASKGLLADLYPMIDADSAFDRADFFPNVLAALEVNGGLYSTVSSFGLSTVIGAASVVGDEPGWTYDEFNAALASMPEGCEAFDVYTTRDDILRVCLSLDMNNFVNWSTGECNFNSKEFTDLLAFAAQFPESFDYDNYEFSAGDDTKTRISEGRQMLLQGSIYSFDSIAYNDSYFGGDATYIGYPTADGTPGNLISIDAGYAISAKSEHKDVAWEFLRQFFTEEYQSDESYVYSIPVNINAYNARIKEAMTPEYEKDGNGNYKLDADGNKIPVPRMSYGTPDGVVDVYALTQEQADKLYAVITSTSALYDFSSDSIFDIVKEQSQAYFSGQKTAEDVAKLVQSKANIYVNEQR